MMDRLTRRDFNKQLSAIAFTVASCFSLNQNSVHAKDRNSLLKDRLFIMSPWFYKYPLSAIQMAKLLNRLGCPRVGYSLGDPRDERWKGFDDLLAGLDKGRCELASVYVGLSIDDPACPPPILDLIDKLKGRRTLVWFYLHSQKLKPSDPAGDETAVRILRTASEAAKQSGLQISIYPHFSNWVERTEDAFRIAQKTDRDNVGCTFNLYHWLKVEGPENLNGKAKMALPKLNALTVNGSFKNARDLQVVEGIKPLGDGDYDVETFVRTFVELGYNGPIGLQGYGIEGDIPALLTQSLKVWDAMCERI